MPGSLSEGKDWIGHMLEGILLCHPIKNVLDVGVGEGTYSDLFRRRFGQVWYGIEIYSPYVERFHLETKYDKLVIGDVRQYVPDRRFTVAIFGDVLEHLPLSDACDVYHRLLASADFVFISIPIVTWHQGAWGGNPYEAHLTQWDHEKVLAAFPGIYGWFKGEQVGCYVAQKNANYSEYQ